MYLECRDYLKGLLAEAGIRTPIFVSRKKMLASSEAHLGAVLLEQERYSKDGSQKVFLSDNGRQRLKKPYTRRLTFAVIMGDYREEALEQFYENFLGLLGAGIVINGNYTAITLEEADWVDKDDSILQAKLAVQAMVTFEGGVYRYSDYARVPEVAIEVKREG